MKHRLLYLIIPIFFSACFVKSMNVGHGYIIQENTKATWGFLEYQSREFMLEQLKRQSELEMWSSTTYSNNLRNIPQSGMVVVHISESSLEAANTAHYTIVVQDQSGEIARRDGERSVDSIPNPPIGSGNWSNVMICYIDTTVTFPLKIFVIHKLLGRRQEYTIKEPGTVSLN